MKLPGSIILIIGASILFIAFRMHGTDITSIAEKQNMVFLGGITFLIGFILYLLGNFYKPNQGGKQ